MAYWVIEKLPVIFSGILGCVARVCGVAAPSIGANWRRRDAAMQLRNKPLVGTIGQFIPHPNYTPFP